MTPTIELHDLDAIAASLLETDPGAFERQVGLRLNEVRAILPDLARQTVAVLTREPRPAPWGAYLGIEIPMRQVVGTCAFKAGPNDRSEVEIAYCTFPPFEGRGVATAMAAALVKIARLSAAANTVLAHTLPKENASTRILRKLDFRLARTAMDPEDGLVWRWEHKLRGAS